MDRTYDELLAELQQKLKGKEVHYDHVEFDGYHVKTKTNDEIVQVIFMPTFSGVYNSLTYMLNGKQVDRYKKYVLVITPSDLAYYDPCDYGRPVIDMAANHVWNYNKYISNDRGCYPLFY